MDVVIVRVTHRDDALCREEADVRLRWLAAMVPLPTKT